MTDELTLRDLDRSIQKLALAVEAIITKLELIGQHQGEKNDHYTDRLRELERLIWKDTESVINQLNALHKSVSTLSKAEAANAARNRSFWDGINAAVVIKGVLFVISMAALGVGYSLTQMAKGG